MPSPIRVLQLSDTHFLEPGQTAEGGGAYDTTEAFESVFEHAAGGTGVDLVVVTGDVADHGRRAQYVQAADAFARFDAPVNLCPGNHDRDAEFFAGVGRPGVGTSRVIQTDHWCFLFVDSNAGAMITTESGLAVDADDPGDRLHRNGTLGQREASWVKNMCATTDAEHVWIWLHHPPAPDTALSYDADYEQEWASLLDDLPAVRGLGGGHTHVPTVYEFAGRPVHVAPSLKNNFDLDANTWLPPGYRTYAFADDGSVSSEVQLVDDDRWPRRPMGRAIQGLFSGELTYDDLAAIAARRAAERAEAGEA